MINVKRYHMDNDGAFEVKDGEWVLYSDHLAVTSSMQAAIAELTATIDTTRVELRDTITQRTEYFRIVTERNNQISELTRERGELMDRVEDLEAFAANVANTSSSSRLVRMAHSALRTPEKRKPL